MSVIISFYTYTVWHPVCHPALCNHLTLCQHNSVNSSWVILMIKRGLLKRSLSFGSGKSLSVKWCGLCRDIQVIFHAYSAFLWTFTHPKWVLVTMATGFVLSTYSLLRLFARFNRFSRGWRVADPAVVFSLWKHQHIRGRCFQYMLIPCVVGEMMQRNQWRGRLYDSCHFE